MVGQNQNWERSDQPKGSLQKVGAAVLRNLRFWLVAMLPVLILRRPRWIFVWPISLWGPVPRPVLQ